MARPVGFSTGLISLAGQPEKSSPVRRLGEIPGLRHPRFGQSAEAGGVLGKAPTPGWR